MSSMLSKLASELSLLSFSEKKKFLKEFFDSIPLKQRESLVEYVWSRVYPDKYRKLNIRIERILKKSPNTTPKVAAQMALYYLRINQKMMPLAIKLARRAKDRLRKRNKKNKLKSNTSTK